MPNKKALIITYYEAPNYGAFLQAYSTQKFLRQNGVEAKICRHIANKPNILNWLLDKRVPAESLAYRDALKEKIDQAQKYLQYDEDGENDFNLAIIGSDEVWNIKNLTAVHLPIFFQPSKRAKKTVAYAACAGRCETKHMKLLPYTSGIRKLDAVSVRDAHTCEMAKAFGVENPVRTLDPTFLYHFDTEIPPRSIHEDYLLIYTYGLDEKSIHKIQYFAKKENLRLVATGSICEWADENPLPTPFEWLSLIKNSKYVITSTFHGTVFSIQLNKQFITIETTSNKVKSLLEELNLTDRLKNGDWNADDLMNCPIDYNCVNEIVEKRSRESAQFLLDNL